jgi:Fe-Mn family superoxide dismutase
MREHNASNASNQRAARRRFLRQVGTLAVGAVGIANLALPERASGFDGPQPFTLPPLPYAYDALEPSIDTLTMQIHHDKHHAAYIKNLNAALEGQADLQKKSIEDILSNLDSVPEKIRMAVRNNGGGHYNHSLFWKVMGPGKGAGPSADLASAINSTFESFDNFKKAFSEAAVKRFGSGWAWLSVGKDGKLVLESLPNQDSPISAGSKPILGLDVWEHAYYLKYQNLRPAYVEAWWNVVNWDEVSKNYAAAKS